MPCQEGEEGPQRGNTIRGQEEARGRHMTAFLGFTQEIVGRVNDLDWLV